MKKATVLLLRDESTISVQKFLVQYLLKLFGLGFVCNFMYVTPLPPGGLADAIDAMHHIELWRSTSCGSRF